MDPVLRILDAAGKSIHLIDDDSIGPDFRFSYLFADAGEYLVQIHDNRFNAGGAYYLRVGDFPIVRHTFPLAIQKGRKQRIEFATSDGQSATPKEIEIPADFTGESIQVDTRLDGADSSTWVTAAISDIDQVTEGQTTEGQVLGEDPQSPLLVPIGISGQLSEPGEHDSYNLRGTKNQTVRISSRTHSLGCPTLLRMQLLDAAGTKVAETTVSDLDEWNLDYTFPDDGTYRLEVCDLLSRGGSGFGYWVEIKPAGSFAVAVKADAATGDRFAIEEGNGACAIDLQVDRFGYEGAIDLSLCESIDGIRIVDPRIPAKAKAARIYLMAEAGWKPSALNIIRLRATAAENSNLSALVSSAAFQRHKEPFVLVPAAWRDGAISLAGVSKTDSPFSMEPGKPLQFARPITKQIAGFTLKRIDEKFTAAVTMIPVGLSADWGAAAKLDKDSLAVTFSRQNVDTEPDQIPLNFFAEHGGHGRIETFSFPIEWIDPLQVTLEPAEPLVAGNQSTMRAKIVRQGDDPQPVVIKLVGLPAGITGPESITAALDQSEIEFQLDVAPDVKAFPNRSFLADASTAYGGSQFTISSNSVRCDIVELPSRLEVFPIGITLNGPKSRRQLVVTGFDAADSPRDWTRDVHLSVADAGIAEIVDGVIYAKSDGATEVLCEIGGISATASLVVSNSQSNIPVAFESEVLVALSKQGCNSGACHGSPSGKGGFRLSLRAFDKQLDELTLIREDFGRRVNTLEPQRSLLLEKPTMGVSHGGGKKLRKEDDAYKILIDWIAEGAHVDPEGTPRCDRLDVFPKQKRVLAFSAGGQQLAITAQHTDGTSRDVTHLVAYSSSNTDVATVDEFGLVTPHQQGEAVILARYLEHIESVPLMFVRNVDNFHWETQPANNYVDELVDAKLRLLQYQPSKVCSDSEFLRRVYLDVIGLLPTIEEANAFLADADSEKRARLIDQLLERDEYAKFWTLKWGDLLRLTGAMVGDDGVFKYHRWVEESIRDNMPYDQFATKLITATGSTLTNPPANFYRTASDMNECVETISQVFLGARLQCAKCHNHPFERWTQDNYYGLGTFFHRVQRRKTPRPGEVFVYDSDAGEVTQPRTNQTMLPWLPGIGSITAENDQDRRKTFAEWLTSTDNPYFARIEANRIWSQLFSRGIVDPIDDFRDSNPPSNGPLLDALAKDFVVSGFDRKHILRIILNSRTYQASYETNESNQSDQIYFSHQEPRLLSAEQLLDGINQSLGLSQTFGNLPVGTRATQLPAPDLAKVDFLKTFGQPERRTVCACERPGESNLGMAIELFNGSALHEKLRDANNRFRVSLQAGNSLEDTIAELYLASVCRPPSDDELKTALEHCASRDDLAAGVEDVCWALFNTDEFVFQH